MARPFAGEEFTCLTCKTIFRRSQSQIAQGRIKFCSLKCSGKAHSGKNNHQYKHGHARKLQNTTPTFNTWRGMIDRCYTKSSTSYKRYGGKGISVCDRWKNSFKNFLEDMGERPEQTSLDRIDGSKGYFPGNCRWATNFEQSNNQKSNVKVEWEGQEYNVSELMRKLGLYTKSGVYYSRLKRGWPVEKTFSTPV